MNDLNELLKEVAVEMQHAVFFISSKEKMNSVGQDQFQECLKKVIAYNNADIPCDISYNKCLDCGADMIEVCSGLEGLARGEAASSCSHSDYCEKPTKRELVGWQSIKSAPENADVLVKTESGYVFPAKYDPTCSLNDKEEVCGGWLATLESFCPPCWSDDQCWESNSDGIMSEQPIAWKPLNSIEVQTPEEK